MSKVKHFSTAKLKELIDSAPYWTTDCGTEYWDEQDEIKEEYWRRNEVEAEKQMRQFENREILKSKTIAQELGLKWCPRCDENKALHRFYNRSDYKHLKRSHCIDCTKDAASVPF